jgi:phosphoglucomutase
MESTFYACKRVDTKAYTDQNPGTSGLRKKVSHFQQANYIENFVQCIFDAHLEKEYLGKTLIIGGDGRYYNDRATDLAIKIAAANGIKEVLVAENGVMSTPAVSLLVRAQPKDSCFGAIILTASHNPGGPHEDLGIKFNNAAGAPAPENITSKIFNCSKNITHYFILNHEKNFSLKEDSHIKIKRNDQVLDFTIKIQSTTALYVETMQKLFDFTKLKSLFSRSDFKFAFDAMHGASGAYAVEIFNKILAVPKECLYNCETLEDFGGLHPDPNLVYAKNLVQVMDINNQRSEDSSVPDFGAACDGDADRNMILGKRFFVSPSDSLAMIVSNYKLIQNLNRGRPLAGVARSMPTSGALDRVAKAMGIKVIYI